MIRILLVDDQTLVRQGIQTLLDLEEDLTVVGAAANGQQTLAMVEQLQPDVVLMDVRMPVMEGVAATREITKRWPHIGVIILTTFDDDEICDRGLKSRRARVYAERCRQQRDCRSGADCGPRRGIDPAEHHPQSAGRVHPAGRWQGAGNAAVGPLTEREMDVLRRIVAGQSNREIADQLCARSRITSRTCSPSWRCAIARRPLSAPASWA